MFVLEVNKKTLFAKFIDVYPECLVLIDDEPKLYPLICLNSHCHRAKNCMEKLAKRVKSLFDAFPQTELLVLYYKYRDVPGRIRAGVFWRDMREPRLIIVNPHAWEKMKEIGTIYEWDMPLELKLGG